MQKNSIFTGFLLGSLVTLLSWNFIVTPKTVEADSNLGSNNGIIAVTGAIANDVDGLWVIDTRNSEGAPSLALYVPRNRGRSIKLTAARRIKYDLRLVGYKDESKVTVKDLRKNLEKINTRKLKHSK